MIRYAEVAVDLSASAVDRLFTYRVPDGLSLAPGQRVAVPFGGRTVNGLVLGLTDVCTLEPERVKDVLRTVEETPVVLPELIDLARHLQASCHCTLAAALRLMIPPALRAQRSREKTIAYLSLVPDGDALEAEKAKRARNVRQLRIIELLEDGEQPKSYLNAEVKGASDAIATLVKDGVLALSTRATNRSPFRHEPTRSKVDPPLTPAQAAAADEITRAMDAGGGRFLLSGVTGSGKTEVYIRAIRHALETERGAIVLVPEIALTPQMTDWFRARFGDDAAVLHSRLSDGERCDEWRRIRAGRARVVIGARSAVFAPIERLGVIVVDEEHEHTYQSDKRPRYDAREVAAFRCAAAGAALVLGSATPAIASYMRTMPGVRPENRYRLLELSQRVLGRPMPKVEIVDMCRELQRGNHSLFSAALQDALAQCLAEGHQAMLLMNRRGYSTFVSCRACGHVETCDACDVSMTYHQTDNLLRCHYCGATRLPPKRCPSCQSPLIKFFGAGTQKVAEETAKCFPDAKVLRMDLDTTRGKDAHETLLNAFRDGKADILIGTQMIAKGLDFPNVTLVGVVAADMTLNLPDYRSAERTFQLLTQVEGRAGRAELPGRVIVQTYNPDSFAIRLAARQDYRAFYHEEEKNRRRGLYPPFTVMARILIAGLDQAEVQAMATTIESELNVYLGEAERRKNVIQMRALEAPIGKLRGETRYQVFIKLYARKQADEILDYMEQLTRREAKGLTLELEINPANMF